MPGYTYPVDYTGTASANRVTNELQLISAPNYRNFKVLIPDFAPFYTEAFTIVHQDSGYPLVEGSDYLFTHQFLDASFSIGLPIYGSISILNVALSGTFVLAYNTIGGEWTLPAAKIAEMLGDLIIGPRVSRWEQITGYPTTFPPINHSHNEDDLTGMSDVVTALLSIKNAIDTAYANGTLSFASANEALQGILGNKQISPATLKVVTDSVRALIETKMNAADLVLSGNSEAFTQDLIGSTSFINDGYNVTKISGNWTLHAGVGYVEGKRIQQLSPQSMVGMSYPTDVYLDVFRNTSGALQTDINYQPVKSVTNLIRYSEDFAVSPWNLVGGTTFLHNVAYGSQGFLNLSSVSTGGGIFYQTLTPGAVEFGKTYLVSGYARSTAGSNLVTINIGQLSPTVVRAINKKAGRFCFPVVAGDRGIFRMALAAAGALEIGELQVEEYSVNHNILPYGNMLTDASWTKVNTTVLNDSVSSPFPASVRLDRISDGTANGIHSNAQTVSLIAGVEYKLYFTAIGLSILALKLTVSSIVETDGISVNLNTTTVTADTAGSTALLRAPVCSRIYADNGDDTGFVSVAVTILPKLTGNYTLTFGLGTGAAYVGTNSSLALGGIILYAPHFNPNLLTASNSFTDTDWVTNAIDVIPDVAGTKLIPTVLNNVGSMTNDNHYLRRLNYLLLSSTTYNLMVEVKAAELSKVYLVIRAGSSAGSLTQKMELYVDLIAGTKTQYATPASGGWTTISSSVTALGSGWFRVQIGGTSSATARFGEVAIGACTALTQGSEVFTGDGVSGFLVRNAQLTIAQIASSYSDNPAYPMSKYVSTTFTPRTDTDGGYLLPYLNNGVRHYPVKISTLTSSLTAVDRRKTIRSYNSILRDGIANNVVVLTDQVVEPNVRYLVQNNVRVFIKASHALVSGDVFYFTKAIGDTFFIRTQDPGVDVLYFHDTLSNTTKSDIEMLVDVDREIKVVYTGTALNVIY